MIEIVTNLSKNTLDEICALRFLSWQDKNSKETFYPFQLSDDLEFSSIHFLIRKCESLIAAARIAVVKSLDSFEEGIIFKIEKIELHYPAAYLGRLVVHPNFRLQGLATTLLKERINWCNKNKISYLFSTGKEFQIKNLEKAQFIKGPELQIAKYPKWNLGEGYYYMYQILNNQS